MSATLKGRAVVWSTGGITYTAGILSASNPSFPQSLKFARNSDKVDVKDFGGTIRAQIFHGFKKTLSLTVIPADVAQSQAGANSSMDAYCIPPGTTLTIVDPSGAVVDGNWNVISSTQNRTVDGVATVDLECEQGDEGIDLTIPVS